MILAGTPAEVPRQALFGREASNYTAAVNAKLVAWGRSASWLRAGLGFGGDRLVQGTLAVWGSSFGLYGLSGCLVLVSCMALRGFGGVCVTVVGF